MRESVMHLEHLIGALHNAVFRDKDLQEANL